MMRRSIGLAPALALIGLLDVANPRFARAHNPLDALPLPGASVVSPRAEARTGNFEMTAVFSKQILAVFLSRFSDGSPVAGAQITASTDLQSADLHETDSGVYSTKELLLASGKNDIEIKFQIGKVAHVQTLDMELPSERATEVASAEANRSWPRPVAIGAAAAALLLVPFSAAFMVVGRSRRTPSPTARDGHAE